MYSGSIFDEVQAIMFEREIIARGVQAESEARRAWAESRIEQPVKPAAKPVFDRVASRFRMVRPW